MKELVKLVKRLLDTNSVIVKKLFTLHVHNKVKVNAYMPGTKYKEREMYDLYYDTFEVDRPPKAALLKIRDVLPLMKARIGKYVENAILVVEPQSYDTVSQLKPSNFMFEEEQIYKDGSVGYFNNDNGVATSGSGGDNWWKVNDALVSWLLNRNRHAILLYKIGKLLKQLLKTKDSTIRKKVRELILQLEKIEGKKLNKLRSFANNVFSKKKKKNTRKRKAKIK